MNPYVYENLARERQEEMLRRAEATGLVTSNPLPAIWAKLRPIGEVVWAVARGIRPRWWSQEPAALPTEESEGASNAA
jgi:hypothetical protein